jgi:hypothetical protein
VTTFDASAMTGPAITAEPTATNGAAADTFDALAMLREQVQDRDQREDDFCLVEVPGIGWRLMCAIDFTYAQYAKWQKAAFPREQRNGRKTNPFDLNQTELAFSVLLNTCCELQYRRGESEEWQTLADDHGAPLLPTSDALLRKFNVVDPRSFLRKLYRREARLIEASQRVAAAAGMLEGDFLKNDDDGDDDAEDFSG